MLTAQDRQYYAHIPTNGSRTLYVGVTNDLERRMHEHKNKLVPVFTSKYTVTWLAYYEQTSDIESAIAREEQIKGWRAARRSHSYPRWKDLSLEWRPNPGQGP